VDVGVFDREVGVAVEPVCAATNLDAAGDEPGLAEPGATDITARYRRGPRLVVRNGSTYLLPTIIHCTSSSHALANREFLFPYASVVDVSPEEMASLPTGLGPTLSATLLTADTGLIQRILRCDVIGRLNLGEIQTNVVAWEQPHEGNLFDHLYGRRAFQAQGGLATVGA